MMTGKDFKTNLNSNIEIHKCCFLYGFKRIIKIFKF